MAKKPAKATTPDEMLPGHVRVRFASPSGVTINGDRYSYAAGENTVPEFVLSALAHSNQTYELL